MTNSELQCLRVVLADVRFPAARWEIVTAARLFGADWGTCRRLACLAAHPYENLREVALALDAGDERSRSRV